MRSLPCQKSCLLIFCLQFHLHTISVVYHLGFRILYFCTLLQFRLNYLNFCYLYRSLESVRYSDHLYVQSNLKNAEIFLSLFPDTFPNSQPQSLVRYELMFVKLQSLLAHQPRLLFLNESKFMSRNCLALMLWEIFNLSYFACSVLSISATLCTALSVLVLMLLSDSLIHNNKYPNSHPFFNIYYLFKK